MRSLGVSSISGGQARNIGVARDRLIELSEALRVVGLVAAADRIYEEANFIWSNADALYCEILSLEADNNNNSGGRRDNNLSKRKSLCKTK